MAHLNPEAISFNPVTSVHPPDTPTDMGSCSMDLDSEVGDSGPWANFTNSPLHIFTDRRTASDPGHQPSEDDLDDLKLPSHPDEFLLLSPTGSMTAFNTYRADWGSKEAVDVSPECYCNDCEVRKWQMEAALGSEEFVPTPTYTGMCYEPNSIVYAEPDQMDPMYYCPEPFCQAPPAAPVLEPIYEPQDGLTYEYPEYQSNAAYGFVPSIPFALPGPSQFIFEHSICHQTSRKYLDTFGSNVVVEDSEDDEDDEYVVFGLDDPSEQTAFARELYQQQAPFYAYEYRSMAPCAPPDFYQEGPAGFYEGEVEYEDQYCGDHQGEFCETYEAADCEAAEQPTKSKLNPEAPEFVEAACITLPGMKTEPPRLKLAWQPFIIRARSLSISEEDLKLAGLEQHL